MKILLLGPSLESVGGVSSVLKTYIEEIKPSLKNDKIEIIYLSTQIDGSKFDKLNYAVKQWWSFVKILNGKDIDIVHAHTGISFGLWRKLFFLMTSSFFKSHTILHLHTNLESFYHNSSKASKIMLNKLLKKVNYFAVLSDSNSLFLDEIIGVDKKKIKKINNPLKITKPTKPTLNTSLKSNQRINLIHVGELCEEKGIYQYIKLKDMLKEHPEFIFYCAGKNPQNIKFSELGIINLGYLSKQSLIEQLSSMSYLVLLTSNDQQPMVISEALSLGIPCISTDTGDIKNMINHNENGWIVDRNDLENIKSLLINNKQDVYEKMKMNAIQSSSKFSPDNVSKQLVEYYFEITNED